MSGSPLLFQVWATPDRPLELTPRAWETLLAQAGQARMLARLAFHYLDKGWMPQVPAGPRVHLESAIKLSDRQQHEVRWEVNRIQDALRDFAGPVVLLKGAAYLMAELPPSRGRLFSDVDLLVPKQAIAQAEGALFSAGWIGDEEEDGYNERYYREWMHEIPPLHHIHRDTYIDLHHTITPPTSRYKVDGGKLLARLRPLPAFPGLYTLAPDDMVLHSAVHLFQEGEFGHGLRDLLDLHDLLTHFGRTAGFWDGLMTRTVDLGLQIPLFHALFHLRRLFGLAPPAHLRESIERMGPNPVYRTAMAWMLGRALRPIHPSCDMHGTGLARWLLYVRSHALRMPPHLLVPHLARKSWMTRFPKKPD